MSDINLSAIRGDTEVYELTLTDGESPLDLTAADIVFTAKRRLADTDFLFQKVIGDGIEIDDDPTTGLATLTIEASDTGDLPSHATYLAYDLEVTVADVVKTPLRGRLRVIPDVSTAVQS
jgi:hypothetical protein